MQPKYTEQANVNPDEIKKFDALSSKWWDLKGEFAALHQINPLRLDYVANNINGLAGKRVIDIGCGGGILSESMAKEGAIVTGLDMAQDALAVARQHAENQNISIDYQQDTVESFAEKHAGTFDVVTCMEMLEHVPDPASVIAACIKLVKPNGYLFFSTINRNLKAWFLLIAGAEYIARMVPKGTHDPKKFIRPSELSRWLEENNAEISGIVGIEYSLFKNKFSLSDNVDTNYILHAIKPA